MGTSRQLKKEKRGQRKKADHLAGFKPTIFSSQGKGSTALQQTTYVVLLNFFKKIDGLFLATDQS